MDRFTDEVRLLARRRAGALASLLALLLALMGLQEWTARGQAADRAAEARTRAEIATVSEVTNLARRVVDGDPGSAIFAERIRDRTRAILEGAVCERAPLGWRMDAPPEVAAFYLRVEGGASLCTLKERFFHDALRVADGADRPAFERMFAGVNPLRERLNAAADGYAAMADARQRTIMWTSRASLAGLFALLLLQGRLVIGRGLRSLVEAHREIARGLAALRVAYANVAMARDDLASALAASEAARAEAEEARRAEAAANALKTEFLARVSHEVRTPLNAVFGFTALMQAEARSDADAQRLGAIGDNARALLALFDDMIELSRLGAGDVRLETAPFEPRALAQAQIDVAARAPAARGVTFVLTVAPEAEGRFAGDARRIGRVLLALLDNAATHGGPGEVRVDVSTCARGALRFAVSDRGPGVPPEQREAIFAPFAQSDGSETRRAGGLGIGLALARETARALGGALGVGTAPGGGARFWMEAPAPRLAPTTLARAIGD